MMTIKDLESRIESVKDRDKRIDHIKNCLSKIPIGASENPRDISIEISYLGKGSLKIDTWAPEDGVVNLYIRTILEHVLENLEKENEEDSVRVDDIKRLEDFLNNAKKIQHNLDIIKENIYALEQKDLSMEPIGIVIRYSGEYNLHRIDIPSNKENLLAILRDSEKYYQEQLDELLDIEGL